MDWQVKGLATDPAYFSGFEIQQVLIEFDGPRLFTAQTPVCKALFMLIDEDDQAMRFIVAPTNAYIIEQLEQGLMTVRAALDQALVWVVEIDYAYTVSEAWSTTLAELPESVLPQKGVMLWPHLQPAFRGRDEKIATLEGVVAEMDRDNLSFTLRQTSDGKDHNCTFSPEIFDEVMDAFVQATTVAISGRETLKNGNIDVSLFNKAGNEQLQ